MFRARCYKVASRSRPYKSFLFSSSNIMSTVEWREDEITALEAADPRDYDLQDMLKLLDYYAEQNGGEVPSVDTLRGEEGYALTQGKIMLSGHEYNDLVWYLGREPNRERWNRGDDTEILEHELRGLEHKLSQPPSSLEAEERGHIAQNHGFSSHKEMMDACGLPYYENGQGSGRYLILQEEEYIAEDLLSAIQRSKELKDAVRSAAKDDVDMAGKEYFTYPDKLFDAVDYSTGTVSPIFDLYMKWADEAYWADALFDDPLEQA